MAFYNNIINYKIKMENRKCKDCKWWSPTILVCFHNENEGIRIFNGDQKACQWWNKPQTCEYLDEND